MCFTRTVYIVAEDGVTSVIDDKTSNLLIA